MFDSDAFTTFAPPATAMGHGYPKPATVIDDEQEWRALPHAAANPSRPMAAVTRWRSDERSISECNAQTADDCHIVKVVLRNMNIRLAVTGQTVHDGLAAPGTFHVTAPGAPVRCLFRGPYDVLHLHIPDVALAECAHERAGTAQGRRTAEMAAAARHRLCRCPSFRNDQPR